MSTLATEQAAMRRRWADPLYRLTYGMVDGALPTEDFTLGVENLTYEALLEKIEANAEKTLHPSGHNVETALHGIGD